MEKHEFKNGIERLTLLAALIEDIPTEEMLEAISRSESVGPLIDPSLWMKAQDGNKFTNMKDLVRVSNTFKQSIKELRSRELETTST